MKQKVVILDFGSQYTQLIARRVRELEVYCEIYPYSNEINLNDTIAVILSGSPFSVNDPDAPEFDLEHYINAVPLLGVCYGAQYIAKYFNGHVGQSNHREYGKALLSDFYIHDPLFKHFDQQGQVWMSHADTIKELPEDFELIAGTESIEIAAFKSKQAKFTYPVYGIQFHPEVTHTLQGKQLLANFLFDIAGCRKNWSPESFIDETVRQLKERIGEDGVLMALSGGVDSTVAATLLHKAIGDQLHCFFIDNGLLRKNEFEKVLKTYTQLGFNIDGVDAKEAFYRALKGKIEPESKRKAIGKTFIDIFQEQAEEFRHLTWLGQGTIYPDVIESVSVHGPSVTIKSHHNVGGLPEDLKFKIVEPLRMLFKDEVRKVGHALGLPEIFIGRHPFPGPGLGIRILGEITPDKVAILQQADDIFIQSLIDEDLYQKVWQAGVILLPVQSVGVMGDGRTYEQVVALRAVNSNDGMTAEWSHLPFEFLAKVSSEIINKVKGINRVVYDISTKPPATIEWE